jgi:glycosyltransferase involved in cell wall biosynthesis
MKILFVISHLTHEGPVHALHSIVEGFRALGSNEITVLTLSGPEKDVLSSQFVQLGVNYENIPVSPLWPISGLCQIRGYLKRNRFDVAASTCIRADAMLALASCGLTARKIFTTVQNIPKEDLSFLYPGWRGRAAAWLHYQVLRFFGNRIICVSTAIKDHLQERIGATGICVLNPVTAPVFDSSRSAAAPVIVYAASLSERKNSREAISFVLQSLPREAYSYEIYGKGPLEDDLRAAYRDEPQLYWLGYTTGLANVFGRASVYVSSSRSEGFPLTPQLALMCGCPCVLSDIPQHQEMAAMSPFIFLYRSGDQGDFERALRRALTAAPTEVRADGLRLSERISPKSVAAQLYDTFKFS